MKWDVLALIGLPLGRYMNMDENKASPSHDVRTNTLSKCVGGESEVEKLFMFIQSENNLIISKFYHVEQEN